MHTIRLSRYLYAKQIIKLSPSLFRSLQWDITWFVSSLNVHTRYLLLFIKFQHFLRIKIGEKKLRMFARIVWQATIFHLLANSGMCTSANSCGRACSVYPNCACFVQELLNHRHVGLPFNGQTKAGDILSRDKKNGIWIFLCRDLHKHSLIYKKINNKWGE